RLELCMLLENEHVFELEINDEPFSSCHPLSGEKVTSFLSVLSVFNQCEPYINKSAMPVQAHFSLQCTCIIFCTLGLCHFTVVDPQNQVVGVITRKDLMLFPLEERLRL
ncbi:CLCA protein, partial [Brachypteracias leptosomus]|nr:CLCA protein [Brachypteracias leptosomus]